MAYRVELRRNAQRDLDALPANHRDHISRAIELLCENPRPSGVKKLKGDLGWRIRVGSYRVLYTIWDKGSLIIVEGVVRRTTTSYD